MQIEVKKEILAEMAVAFPGNLSFEPSDHRWVSCKTVDSKFLSKEEVEAMLVAYERTENSEKIEDRREARKLRSLLKLLSGDAKRIVNLNQMSEALKMVIADFPRHWVFKEDKTSGMLVPFFVQNIVFHATRDFTPAHITISGAAMYRGSQEKLEKTVYRDDLGAKGCSASDLLNAIGLFPETEDVVADYEEQMATYVKLYSETGLQLVGRGYCVIREDRWNTTTISLDKGGIVSKLVIDDMEDRKDRSSDVVSCAMWNKKHGSDGEEADVYKLPVHPFIRVFNLKIHQFIHIHVNNVDVYEYDTSLTDKLVLADDKRELIDLLVSSGGDDSRDIVQGKSGGIIIITSGPPGTGKTLTAEVFSEKVQRPLYVVQCSQLGTDSDALEKKLGNVLEQAVRWSAVLLIDEADVYIHERGDDIQQNAVVGVFLRLLEYYSGVLFLTTNRECVIDDAIMSRAIAHVRYTVPSPDECVKLWGILSAQYGVPFSDDMCRELSMTFRRISGRSVKQLIRLGKALAASRGQELTVDTLVWVAKFQPIESDTEEVTLRGGRKFPVMRGVTK